MKQELSPKVVGAAIGALVLALAIGAVVFFRSGSGSTATVTPKPWKPPGQWAGASGGAGPGAPAAPGGATEAPAAGE